jgi:hypothetical protein
MAFERKDEVISCSFILYLHFNNGSLSYDTLSFVYRRMDCDGDGKLDFAEFLAHAYGIYKNYVEFETAGAAVPTAEEKFAELDVNKDRYIYIYNFLIKGLYLYGQCFRWMVLQIH